MLHCREKENHVCFMELVHAKFTDCGSVCLFNKRELTSTVIDRVKNEVTYPVADGGQKSCGICPEMLRCKKLERFSVRTQGRPFYQYVKALYRLF